MIYEPSMPPDPDHQAFTPGDRAFIESLNEPLAFADSPNRYEAPDARAASILHQAEDAIAFEQSVAALAALSMYLSRQATVNPADVADTTVTKPVKSIDQDAVDSAVDRTFAEITADLPDSSEDVTISPMARAALHMAGAEPRIKLEIEVSKQMRQYTASKVTAAGMGSIVIAAQEYRNPKLFKRPIDRPPMGTRAASVFGRAHTKGVSLRKSAELIRRQYPRLGKAADPTQPNE